MRKLVLFLCLFLIIKGAVLAQGVIVKAGSYDGFEIFNGQLWAWGFNNYGALGTGDKTDYHSPKRVGTFSDWVGIYPGDIHTVGKRADGTLWVWGTSNFAGELGLGNSSQVELSPVLLNNDHWDTVAAGVHHTLAIKNDRTLWSWGSNDGVQLGYETYYAGANHATYLPVQVGTGTWKAVSGGYHFSIGIMSDGSLWEWGDNRDFIGNNTTVNTINSGTPKRVGTDNDWVYVSAGYYSSFAIKANGTLWSWGNNQTGQLGIGNNSPAYTPQQVAPGISDWVTVTSGRGHTLAVRSTGQLYAWGENSSGQLGTNQASSVIQYIPKLVNDEMNWSFNISVNGASSFARKKDNTVWAWGGNEYGQLGIGNTINQFTPQQVLLPQNSPLPVTLLDFSATKKSNGNLLNWLTATELNTSRFEIEKSDNGINFTRIATVAAAGNSTVQIRYEYIDIMPSSNKTFYRLKIVDRDNRFTYSKIVVTNGNIKETQIQLYPNPTQDVMHIFISGITNTSKVQMQVVDVAGRLVRSTDLKVNNNEIFTDIMVSDFKQGIYFIKIPEINKVIRFVKE